MGKLGLGSRGEKQGRLMANPQTVEQLGLATGCWCIAGSSNRDAGCCKPKRIPQKPDGIGGRGKGNGTNARNAPVHF